MVERQLPVRPSLDQLRRQAKELLRDVRRGDGAALATLRAHHSGADAVPRLADAQHAVARSYGVRSWARLVVACRLTEAIWRDDAPSVLALVRRDPRLLEEDARGVPGNWGPPLSYAAGLGRDRIVDALRELGASDLQYAFDRACLRGQVRTARRLHAMGARPVAGSVMGPCETLNADGLALLLELGAPFADEHGDPLAPVALILQTYARNPDGKHRCLEYAAACGAAFPDTPVLAVHRGNADVLDPHLRRDPALLARTFAHEEIYPPELGCSVDPSLALHGTPVAGGTLLHLCVEFDEFALARRLLDLGADPDAPAAVDSEGFGGHTALFGCVVSQPYRDGRCRDDVFARLLLDRGADPNARASLRKRLRFAADESEHVYRDVTPRAWGERFHDRAWVNPAALALVAERGGR